LICWACLDFYSTAVANKQLYFQPKPFAVVLSETVTCPASKNAGLKTSHSSDTFAILHRFKKYMPKLLDRVRALMRMRHYSYETEKRYVYWIRRYIGFHNIKNPIEMGAAEVEAFLSHLAVESRISASTQNQALAALLFLYRNVLSVMIYTHVLQNNRLGVRSPVDA